MFKLEEQIEEKLIIALRAKDGFIVSNYRMLKAAIQNERIKIGKIFSEADLIKVLRRELKKRHEAAAGFAQGNKNALAEKELKEAALIKELLPEELSEEKIKEVIDQVISQGNFSGPASFGLVMKETMAKLQGEADGGLVSKLVKEKLAPPA